MSNKLILIRHSIPQLIPSVPPNKWMLNAKGKEQAHLLARQLSTYSIDIIMSSHEPKAIETAQIIADFLNLSVEIVPGLHEHERPPAILISQEDFKKTMAHLFAEPKKLSFGYETADEAGQRFDRTVQQLLRRYPYQGLAIVSHGTVMAMFGAKHLNVDPHSFWRRIGLPGALIFSRPGLQLLTRLSPSI